MPSSWRALSRGTVEQSAGPPKSSASSLRTLAISASTSLTRCVGANQVCLRHGDEVDQDAHGRPQRRVDHPVEGVAAGRGAQHQNEQGANRDLDRALLRPAAGLAGQP